MAYVIFNHQLVAEKEVAISSQDRGFRYGDAIFDTLIIKTGRIYQLEWHLSRINRGLEALRINFDIASLPALCRQLLEANDFSDGLLRIQITRGVGGRGYLPDYSAKPTLIIETISQPSIDRTPVTLWKSSYEKIHSAALPVRFKLAQGLNSTLSRMEAVENACFDAILLNNNGEICETSSANIFWLKNEALYTPSLACGILEGSIRSAIIRLWNGKLYEVEEKLETLATADAVFITNVAHKALAVSGLMPAGLKWKSTELAEKMLDLLENDINNLSK